MKKYLSIYFSIDRTYVILLSTANKGFELNYINSTYQPIDLQKIEDESQKYNLVELNEILSALNLDNQTRIAVSIPVDLALVSQFPGSPDISIEDLRQLVNLEIKQSYPQFNFDDFTSNVFNLAPKIDGNYNLMAVIIPKSDLRACKKALDFLGQPIDNIEISQINAHSSYLFNYPDKLDEKASIFGIQKNFIDVGVISNKKQLYFSMLTLQNESDFKEIIKEELKKQLQIVANRIDTAYIFGIGLNQDLFNIFCDECNNAGIKPARLNAFRMISTNLPPRIRNYCSKVAHIYPPCIGGCVSSYFERIKFY